MGAQHDAWAVAQANPLRKFAFYFGLGLIFVRFSMIHELLMYLTGFNSRLLYIFGPPAILGAILSGAVPRTLRYRAAWMWLAFTAWSILAIPTSYWRGGSIELMSAFVRTVLPLLFIAGGLAMSWAECRLLLYSIGLAGVVNLITARIFMADLGGRFAIEFGTISNPNDIAAHLVLVLPLLFYTLWRSFLGKLIAFPALAYTSYLILGSGSRGALLSLSLLFIFVVIKTPGWQRAALLAGLVLVGFVSLFFITPESAQRLNTLFGAQAQEAGESTELRTKLLKRGIEATLSHPILGVGPGQFMSFDHTESMEKSGARGLWHGVHNSFFEVSADCGIPAFIFYLWGAFAPVFMLNRSLKRVSWMPSHPLASDFRLGLICLMGGMLAFYLAIFFVNFSFQFYLPAIAGVAIALTANIEREFSRHETRLRNNAAAAPPAPASSFVPPPSFPARGPRQRAFTP